MSGTLTPTEASPCLGCGGLVPADAAFCPTCGTRLVADRPMPVTVDAEEVRELERSTNAWLIVVLAVVAALLLGAGMVVGGVVASTGGGGDDGSSDGATAAAMDAYAPIGGDWMDKHVHLAEESSGDDPNGLAAAATDARLWIDVNREDLDELPTRVEGEAAVLFGDLVEVYDERSLVLADIEATANDGGGETATADEMVALVELDDRADTAVCGLSDVMRAEGDDPDDHVTPSMDVTC